MIKDDRHGNAQDGPSYPADAQRLQSYANAEQQLAQFPVPVFIHAGDPHERIFFACLDGTGNDESKPQFGPKTNVANIHNQINELHNKNIRAGYTAGPGTQDGWLKRTGDGISGATYNERLEDAYKQLIDQVYEWKKEDPQAVIRVVDTGFSRGGVEAAGLTRLIHERGIQDRDGAIYTKNRDNQITHVEYTKAPLVAPGQVAQAVVLFDPVATGYALEHEDLRLPPSVVSGLQITAADERRSAFKSIHIIDQGMTPDGRFLGVTVAGAHSDIGNSYTLNGLGLHSENIAINYINKFSDTPILQRVAEPDDPGLNVVHRSEKAFPFNLSSTVDRATPAGNIERLVPLENHYSTTQTSHGPIRTVTHNELAGVSDAFNAEPLDQTMSEALERPARQIGQPPVPITRDAPALDPARLQQRALHGENSQLDRAQEARRQQDIQGQTAARAAPLSPAAEIAPGTPVPQREPSISPLTPNSQQAQTPTAAGPEPATAAATATAEPNHAALAAQQAMMHAQRQAQQERQQHEERSMPPSRAAPSLEPGRVAEAAELRPLAATALRDTTTAAPAVAAPVVAAAQTAGMALPVALQATHDPASALRQAAEHHAAPTAPPVVLSPPLNPPSMRDFRHVDHPLNERYQMFRDALGEQGFNQARPTLNTLPEVRGYSAEQKDRLAAGFTARVGADEAYHKVQYFDKDGDTFVAMERPERIGTDSLAVAISKTQALARTPAEHAADWRARELPEPQAVNTARPDPQSLSPDHPGHPGHPRHAMFEHAREALSTEYARWGMQKGTEPLDRETMQVVIAARGDRMNDVGVIRLAKGNPDHTMGEHPLLVVYPTARAEDVPGRYPAYVESQTLQNAPAVHDAVQQFQAVDQQATQQVQQMREASERARAQDQQGPSLGGPGR